MTVAALVSVVHTGVTFLDELLVRARVPRSFNHLHDKREDILAAVASADVVISPLRHPRRVWESLVYHNSNTPADYWRGWETLAVIDRVYPVHYVPVDLPLIRQVELDIIARKLHARLETDWTPRNAYAGERFPVVIPDRVNDVLKMDVIRRFYGGESEGVGGPGSRRRNRRGIGDEVEAGRNSRPSRDTSGRRWPPPSSE